MCLARVTKRLKPDNKVIIGYKVFERYTNSKKARFMHMNHKGNNIVPLRQWLTAHSPTGSGTIVTDNGKRYPLGFHVFRRKVDAQNHAAGCSDRVVRQVAIKQIQTLGIQYDVEIYVAEKMYVGKPPVRKTTKAKVATKRKATTRGRKKTA